MQEVISAQQTNHRVQVYIPTPEAAIAVLHYDSIYSSKCLRPTQYIRVPGEGLRLV